MTDPDRRLDAMARLGRAMVDANRSRILVALLDAPSYPGAIADALELSRANVSNHLTCLRGCGLVRTVEEGRRTRYEIADRHVTQALGMLLDAVVAVDDGTQCDAESCDLACCAAVVAFDDMTTAGTTRADERRRA